MKHGDTIVAISSATGSAPRMIVRVSGTGASGIVEKICPASNVQPGKARHNEFEISNLKFTGWIYTFGSPHSYTGEDLVEFHIPGNLFLAKTLVEEIVKLGARHAEPGEFTARAYFNGRMDLSQAEGVAATISAHNEAELRAARQLMAGELARRLRPVMELIGETLALVEVGIDFSEEDVTFLSALELQERLERARWMLENLVEESARFERLSAEPVVVLVGRPNAGKSTLLNALSGQERAVVSPVAGTTRDAISVEVQLKRGWVRVVDAAGMDEEEGGVTKIRKREGREEDKIEQKMQERTREVLGMADVVVMVKEAGDRQDDLKLDRESDLVVRTKADLLKGKGAQTFSVDGVGDAAKYAGSAAPPTGAEGSDEAAPLVVSAVTGEGLDQLEAELNRICFGDRGGGEALALNGRHLDAIAEARQALGRVRASVEQQRGAEVVAMELREALDRLGDVLGRVSPEEVLGRVFGRFCIGK